MKLAHFVIATVLSGSLPLGCSSSTSSDVDAGGAEAADGAPAPSDSSAEASGPREAGTLGASCNISPACDAPQECCLTSLADLGLSGVCVAPGTCQGIALGCEATYECPDAQACCVTAGSASCQVGTCAAGSEQLCDPGYAGHGPPECPSGESCAATRVCVPSEGGVAEASADAAAEQ